MWKTFSVTALFWECAVMIGVIIVISTSIKKRKATGDYLKDIVWQIALKVIFPTVMLLAAAYAYIPYLPETIVLVYLLYISVEYGQKHRHSPPSSLKIVREFRPYYWQIEAALSPFSDCATKFSICDSARAYLYTASSTKIREPSYYCEDHTSSCDEDYDRIFKSELYDEKCETWALCFILFIIDEGSYRSEKAQAIKMYIEYRLNIRYKFTPIEFLRAFRACKFIGELYKRQIQEI